MCLQELAHLSLLLLVSGGETNPFLRQQILLMLSTKRVIGVGFGPSGESRD